MARVGYEKGGKLMDEHWYRVIKDEEYCSQILDIFCRLHDYMITQIEYQNQNNTAYVYLRYDTDDEGVLLKFIGVNRINICPLESNETPWLEGANIQLTEDRKILWYDIYDKCEDKEVFNSRDLNWIEAEEMQFAWLDINNSIIPLPDDRINPAWSVLNYESGKYEKIQKHFKVYKV